jgi:ABC-type uncharacterized transport system involved in gliding motility auxiliary subunit
MRMKLARIPLPIRNLAFGMLLLAGAVLAYLLAAWLPVQQDVTQNARNSLEPASQQVLQQLHGPVHVTVFSSEIYANQGDARKLVRDFISIYQRYRPDITLDFVDPSQHPDVARKAEIQVNGEIVVEYEGRREHLSALNHQSFAGALLTLAHRKDQLVMYVTGHGERKLDGIANDDLGEFGRRLSQLGFRVASLDLAISQDVPANVSLLVVTQPQVDWIPGEVDALMRFVDRGGNILWLVDPGPLHGLAPLAQRLGVMLPPGVVIDPDAQLMRAPPTWTLGANYPPHAITRDFNMVTVFPFARALGREESQAWRYSTLVSAAPRGWVSPTVPRNNETPRFDKRIDAPGPVDLAAALERTQDDRIQRAVVVGSGSFLSNMYAGNGRNLDLGINMVNWLCDQENFVTILPKASKDDAITLSLVQLEFISIGLAVVVPFLLVLAGVLAWWRRKT